MRKTDINRPSPLLRESISTTPAIAASRLPRSRSGLELPARRKAGGQHPSVSVSELPIGVWRSYYAYSVSGARPEGRLAGTPGGRQSQSQGSEGPAKVRSVILQA